jgi:hypothetical protein
MKKNIYVFLLSYNMLALCIPAHIAIVRHGEKQPVKTILTDRRGNTLYTSQGKPMMGDHLSTRGWERAYALAPFFTLPNFTKKYGTPVAVFAPKPSDSYQSMRPVDTATPTAERLQIQLQKNYSLSEYQQFVTEIMTDPEYDKKTIVIVYEHAHILELLQEFINFKNISSESSISKSLPNHWKGNIFDRLCLLHFTKNDTTKTYDVTFENKPQKLLFGDSNK